MKKYLLLIVFIFSSLTIFAQEDTTTYYLIRHAEKDRTDKSNRNPDLMKKGHDRAAYWSTVLSNVNFDMVYSTKYNRTIQTAKPTADSKKLEIVYYNPSKMFDDAFQKATKGKTVLVVGHSNTTPFFANKILGEEKYKQIKDDNNNNLYIVTVTKGSKTSILLKVVH